MLPLLIKYAEDHGLKPEAGFTSKEVRWAIVCDDRAKFLDVIELGDSEQRRNRGQRFEKCPELSFSDLKSGGETKCHFLIETAEVVALYGDKAGEEKPRAKHAYFVDLLRQAAGAMPELGMAADCLDDSPSLAAIAQRLAAHKANPTDKVTLRLGACYPVESKAWHDWWRAFRNQLSPPGATKGTAASTSDMRCLATGHVVAPLAVSPKISGLSDVGGLGMGDALASYKQDSFCSYGLEQAANAAVSEEAAYACRDALNHLIRETGQRLAGAKVVHWFKEKVDPEDDPLSFLQASAEREERDAQQRASKLLESIRTGKKANLAGNYYYALTLSGASGRVMVRDWMEGQFEELVESVDRWFTDLEITNIAGTASARTPGIERVITCLLPERKPTQEYRDWIKAIGPERVQLWHAAIRKDVAIPYSVIPRLVTLNARFVQTGRLDEVLRHTQDGGLSISTLYARMALIKAFHKRKGDTLMAPALNKAHPSPAYHCGRIMYVLARIQKEALPRVQACVIQRYYAAASSTPALVLGRLIRNSKFHLNTIAHDKPGLAVWFDDKLKEVCGQIKDRMPAVLTLEQQSLFALGYYHEMADRNEPSNNGNA